MKQYCFMLISLFVVSTLHANASAVSIPLSPAERAWVAAHPVIHIQMSDESPPFEYKEKGQYKGIAYNYLLEAARRIGVKIEVTGIEWTEALKSISTDHRVDLLLCISPSPERAQKMLFTRSYLSFPQVIFAERQHGFISKVSDLSLSHIAVERDYLMEQWLRRDLPLARLHVTDGPREALKLLATSQVDAYIGNLATTTFLIDQMGLVNLEVVAPSGYDNDDFSMGIRKDWPELKAMLDRAIASFSQDDERTLRDPWLALRYEHGLRPIDIVKWVLLVAGVLLLFIWQLRRMVKLRTAELKASLAQQSELQRRMDEQRAQTERLQAVGTLAGGIAHDFNNILAAILGNTELALSRKPEGELKHDLEVLYKAGKRAADLTKQILAFSRGSAEAPQSVALRQAIDEAMTLLRAAIPTSIRLEAELKGEATVLAVPGDIHRILVNLATNAAQAMAGRGGTLTIALREVPYAAIPDPRPEMSHGAYAELSVSDDGIGMDAQVMSRLFEPFYSTRKASGGTGMGLAVVHGLVSSMGGSISVQSQPGQGSTFCVFLPLLSQTAGSAGMPYEEPLRGEARVLFVDDETMIVNVMQRSLTLLGYTVDAFDDPQAALAALRRDVRAYDVLISDLTMPGMNGYDLARQAKALRPDLPIILCTGLNESEDGRAPVGAIFKVMQKPMSLAALTRAMHGALSSRA